MWYSTKPVSNPDTLEMFKFTLFKYQIDEFLSTPESVRELNCT